MKFLVSVITLSVLLVAGTSFAGANEAQLLPTIKIGSSTTDMYGWTWLSFEKDHPSDEFDIRKLRFRLDSKWERWGVFLDIEANDGIARQRNGQTGNWLLEGRVSYAFNENWQIYVGRLFLTGGFPTPPPFRLETALYPRFPFALAATGVQLKGSVGEWDLTAEVTGQSGTAFDDERSFDRAELGLRAKKHLSKVFWVAGTTQLSEDFQRFALDFDFAPTKEHLLRGAIYEAVEKSDLPDKAGGYVYYGWRPLNWLELHGQLDYQARNGLLATTGVRLWCWHNRFSLIVDYEVNVDDGHGRAIVRQQFRF